MHSDLLAEPGHARFGRFLLIALLIEALALASVLYAPMPRPAQIIKPPPIAVHLLKPAPPKPTPPKPVPPPPAPAPALPKPPPPLPHHPPQPRKPIPKRPVHPIARPITRPTIPSPAVPTTPAPPIAAPIPPPSPALIQSAEARYVGTIKGIVLGNLVVPAALRNLGASGVATIAFTVDPSGQILAAKVLRASDYAAANRAALAAVRDSRFPAFFANMPHHPIIFELNINVSGAE